MGTSASSCPVRVLKRRRVICQGSNCLLAKAAMNRRVPALPIVAVEDRGREPSGPDPARGKPANRSRIHGLEIAGFRVCGVSSSLANTSTREKARTAFQDLPLAGKIRKSWGCSSAGRAPRSQRGGQRFDPAQLHHTIYKPDPAAAAPSNRSRANVYLTGNPTATSSAWTAWEAGAL